MWMWGLCVFTSFVLLKPMRHLFSLVLTDTDAGEYVNFPSPCRICHGCSLSLLHLYTGFTPVIYPLPTTEPIYILMQYSYCDLPSLKIWMLYFLSILWSVCTSSTLSCCYLLHWEKGGESMENRPSMKQCAVQSMSEATGATYRINTEFKDTKWSWQLFRLLNFAFKKQTNSKKIKCTRPVSHKCSMMLLVWSLGLLSCQDLGVDTSLILA